VRTQDEILAEARRSIRVREDPFGTYLGELIMRLPFDVANEFLTVEATAEKFGDPKPCDDETVIGELREYMAFAWDKANNCRGLSAVRSLYHMKAWLWLLGEDDAATHLFDDYRFYGKPQLAAICEHYAIDWKALDDGNWTNDESCNGPVGCPEPLKWNQPALSVETPPAPDKITAEEMRTVFGTDMPIEAVKLLWETPDDWTVGQVRAELRRIMEERKKARTITIHIKVPPEPRLETPTTALRWNGGVLEQAFVHHVPPSYTEEIEWRRVPDAE